MPPGGIRLKLQALPGLLALPIPTISTIPITLDIDGNGELSRDEVVKGSRLLELTKKEAERLFDRLDVVGEGDRGFVVV